MELTDVLIGEMWSDRLSNNLDNHKYNFLLQTVSGIKNYALYALIDSNPKEKTLENRFKFIELRNRLIQFTSYLDTLMDDIEEYYGEALAIYQKNGKDSVIFPIIANRYGKMLHSIGNTVLQEFNNIMDMSREHVDNKLGYTQ